VFVERRLLAGLTDQTEHVYGEARYAAGSGSGDAASLSKRSGAPAKIKRRRINRDS